MLVYRTFSDVINAWPTAEEFGRDIGVIGVTARQMRNRNSIAPEYWNRTVEKAKERKFAGITLALLAQLAEENGKIGGAAA